MTDMNKLYKKTVFVFALSPLMFPLGLGGADDGLLSEIPQPTTSRGALSGSVAPVLDMGAQKLQTSIPAAQDKPFQSPVQGQLKPIIEEKERPVSALVESAQPISESPAIKTGAPVNGVPTQPASVLAPTQPTRTESSVPLEAVVTQPALPTQNAPTSSLTPQLPATLPAPPVPVQPYIPAVDPQPATLTAPIESEKLVIEKLKPEEQGNKEPQDLSVYKEEENAPSIEIPEQRQPVKPVIIPPVEAELQPEISEMPGSLDEGLEADERSEEELVFNFENADLSNLVSYIETFFSVKFITDEAVKPMLNTGKAIKGNKISFKTSKPLSRQQAWSLFLTFMDLAGLSIVPQADPGLYRIMASAAAKKAALPSYIGIDSKLLPDNDTKIRYVYFVKDVPVETLKSVIGALKSSAAEVLILQELKAFIITDSSYNIKSLMEIVHELDKVSMPQAMSVLKLKRVDADHVKKLYDSLMKTEQGQQPGAARLFAPRNPTTALYFPENMSMVVEPRTNSLILLGTRESIQKIEEFIVKHIDVDPEMPYSPLHVLDLKFADAAMVAEIMTNVSAFGQNAVAAGVGGVRGGDKYFKQMTFTPEQTGNRLIIRGDYDDYLKAKEIIDQLDAPQPQVAIEVLILSVGITDIKQLGTQLRNSPRTSDGTASGSIVNDGLFGNKVSAQTSGSFLGTTPPNTVVQNTNESGVKRLLGDLVTLVTGSAAGNTVLSLGSDAFGVWGIFSALKTISNVQVISNPFLIATNKTKATVSLGETKNVKTATIEGQTPVETFSDKDANLTVEITPQINSDGMIIMKLKVSIVEFRSGEAARATAARTTKVIDTSTIISDKEVLALGGLIKNNIQNSSTKLPVLGNIPLIGWLFKNKQRSDTKEDLLILVSARILDPFVQKAADTFTQNHIGDYKSTIKQFEEVHMKRDPIDRAFFTDAQNSTAKQMDKFIFKRDVQKKEKKKTKRKTVIAGAEKEKELARERAKAQSAERKAEKPVKQEAVPLKTTAPKHASLSEQIAPPREMPVTLPPAVKKTREGVPA